MILDHLVVGGPDLDALTAALAEATGVRAEPGGRHLGHGTHNALVGLGPGHYLELLAPDPLQRGGTFADLVASASRPSAVAWCVRGAPGSAGADAVEATLRAAGLVPRRLAMERRSEGGAPLRWTVVFADGHPFGGLVPFWIDWGDAPHPSERLGRALDLVRVELVHPDADALRRCLDALGSLPAGVDLRRGDRAGLVVEVGHGARRWLVGPAPAAALSAR